MADLSADGNAQPESRKTDGAIVAVTLILAVILPPVGLISALGLGVAARRQGDARRASRYFVVASVALLIIVVLCLIGLNTGPGSSAGVSPQ